MIVYYIITTVLALSNLIFLVFNFEAKKLNYYFIIIIVLMALSNVGYLSIAVSVSLEEAILANKLAYLGGCFIPALGFFMTFDVCNYKVPNIIRNSFYMFSIAVYLLVTSIGYSDIYYKEVFLEKYNNVTVLGHTYGIGHLFFNILMYGYLGLQIIVLIYTYVSKKNISRKIITAIFSTGIVTILLYIVARMINKSIEIVPLIYIFDGWIYLYIFRRGLVYSIEDNIASSLSDEYTYGYIMFDNKLNYLGCNELALKVFPDLSNCIIDKKIKDVEGLKGINDFLKNYHTNPTQKFEIMYNDLHFECTMKKVYYTKKRYGYIIEIKDDTDLWDYINGLAIDNFELSNLKLMLQKKVEEQTNELVKQEKRIEDLFLETIISLSDAVDAKDRYTSGHSKRVAEYGKRIAQKLNLSDKEQDRVYHAGLLHDVGKIRIPIDIINKPGKLTEEEYNIIKVHPITGYHILKDISEDNYIAIGAKYHHERWDGTGYPNGLSKDKIPLIARILCVADSYDAMTSNRSYRQVMKQEEVRNEIIKGKGLQFDPEIADVMIKLIDEDKNYSMTQPDNEIINILFIDDNLENINSIETILDVKMNQIDALDLIKLIRDVVLTPIVLMTTEDTLDLSINYSKYGCEDYITQPFLPLLVKEVIYNATKIKREGK